MAERSINFGGSLWIGFVIVTLYGAALVDRFTEQVKDPAKRFFAHGDHQGRTRIDDFHTAFEAHRAAERYGANPAAAEMLLDLAVEFGASFAEIAGYHDRVVNGWYLFRFEFSVKDAAYYLNYFSFIHAKAPVPPIISSNSPVICVCLARLYSVVKSLIICSALSVAFLIATILAKCSLRAASIKHADIHADTIILASAFDAFIHRRRKIEIIEG